MDGNYLSKIVKFVPGPADDQMWFYFEDPNENNYVKDLKNFRKLNIEEIEGESKN